MVYRYGMTPADVLSDAAGNVLSGWQLNFYDSETGGTRITDLQDLQGNPLPGYVTTDVEGRYRFRRVDETLEILWADDGQDGQRWALAAVEAVTAAGDAVESAQQAAADAAAAEQSASDAAASASAAADSLASAETQIQPAIDDLNAYQQQTPTLEELVNSCYLSFPYTIDGGEGTIMLTAPMAMTLLSCVLTVQGDASVPASDTDYYTFDLERYSGGVFTLIARRSTQVTGANANGSLNQLEPWGYSGVDLTQTTLAEGDVLVLVQRTTGSPPTFSRPVIATLRYAPA